MHLISIWHSDWLSDKTHLTQVTTMSIPGSDCVLQSTFKHDAIAQMGDQKPDKSIRPMESFTWQINI